jgi:hypothetical protein
MENGEWGIENGELGMGNWEWEWGMEIGNTFLSFFKIKK